MASTQTAEIRAEPAGRGPDAGADLPIVQIWLKAAGSPFRYITRLAKFGSIPLALALGIEALRRLLQTVGWLGQLPLYPLLLAMAVVYVPFDVAWTRLIINGTPAIAVRGYFPFRRAEARYLLAAMLLRLSWLIILVPAAIMAFARRGFDHHLVLEGGVLFLVTCVALTIGIVRSLYVLPALAIGKYEGLRKEWRQSRGQFERLIALVALARLPYLLALDLLDRLAMPYSVVAWKATIAGVQSIVYLFGQATAVAAIALAYDHTVKLRTSTGGS